MLIRIIITSFLLLFVFNLSSQTPSPRKIEISTIPSIPQINSPYQIVVNASFQNGCKNIFGYNVNDKDSICTLKIYYDAIGAFPTIFCNTTDTIPISNFVAGTHKIIVKAYSVYGLDSPQDTSSLAASDTIYIKTTGINEFLLANAIKVYPNPAKEMIYVKTKGSIHLTSMILMDNQGKKIKEYKKDERELNISNLSGGIYFLKLQSEKGEVMEKIVVQ